jgi:hypothetical protein
MAPQVFRFNHGFDQIAPAVVSRNINKLLFNVGRTIQFAPAAVALAVMAGLVIEPGRAAADDLQLKAADATAHVIADGEHWSHEAQWEQDAAMTFSPSNRPTSFFGNLADEIDGDLCGCRDCDTYHWEFLPREALYPFYLADTKQSRMAGQWMEGRSDSTLLDGTLGGRFGVFRYVNATEGPYRRGVQLDIETSAQIRLDMSNEHDVRSVDFRAGVPLSFSFGRLQTRVGYYHISSHLGDEFLLKNPGYNRKNYVRDVLFMGAAYWINDSTRVYGEAGWAFYADLSEPWEFIFGIEEAPRTATGVRGAPFYAINGRLREEVNFSGDITAQLGWAWRSSYDSGLLRLGLHYFNGLSNQYSFYQEHEQLVGVGLWYDF